MSNEITTILRELKELKDKYQSTGKLKINFIEISLDDVSNPLLKGVDVIESIPVRSSVISKDYKGLTSGSGCIHCEGLKKYFSLTGYKID